MDDIGADGINLISEIVDIYDLHDFKTEVLAASIRSVQDIVDSAKLGAHVATIPPKILQSMYDHPLTDKGLNAFLKDWKKIRMFGSAALSCAYVASGRCDFYTEKGVHLWDFAAGICLVSEAAVSYTHLTLPTIDPV